MTGGSLSDHTVKLAKTPLGIIALFLLIVEAIAAIVVGSSSSLSAINQTILVIFITSFPIIVLIIFWHIVVNHNVKLYSPSEFPNRGDFLKANNIDPARLLEQFKNDVISEIERSTANALPRSTRGDVELQEEEYLKALALIDKYEISITEAKFLNAITKSELDIDQAKSRYGSNFINRMTKLGLVASTSAGAAVASTDLARIVIKLLF